MKQIPRWLKIAALVLVFPALLVNLGLMTFIDDEGIRSVVALEMLFSGNFITPTINGEYYYNKPPLFNWILAGYYSLFGQANEWTTRLATVVSLLGFAYTVYRAFLRETGMANFAFLQAMLLITCGRILFWDSMLGLIDITFSWVIFSQFYLFYVLFRRERWLLLFLTTYLFTAIGFMLKGLPSLVFTATLLLVWFAWQRKFFRLFYPAHFAGLALLVLLLGSYYFAYSTVNPDLEKVFSTLLFESTKRTPIEQAWWKSLQQPFLFPLEMTYHFLPWSLLLFFLFRADAWQLIRRDPFLFYCGLIFIAWVLPYWLSPGTHPRYILMLCPLYFGPLLFFYRQHEMERTRIYRLFYYLVGVLIGGITLFALAPFFVKEAQGVPLWAVKSLGLFALLLALGWGYWRKADRSLGYTVVVLLVLRLGFDWFVLPPRNAGDPGRQVRESARRVVERSEGRPLHLKRGVFVDPTGAFYLTQGKEEVITKVDGQPGDEGMFLVWEAVVDDFPGNALDSLYLRHSKSWNYLVQGREPN